MRKTLMMSAAFVAALALPASAEVHQIGAVNIANDHYTDVSWEHFEGPVDSLQFVAEGDTIHCDHVSVTYRDGTTHMVWRGTLTRDAIETITFPEGDSRMKHVDFACKAETVDGARIALSAVSQGWDDHMWARAPHVTTWESGEVVGR